ncbi:MAG: hypothetical protein KA079_03455 [Brachymonas sp.]|nr:hypothetical protein [Brachymonas sp.]
MLVVEDALHEHHPLAYATLQLLRKQAQSHCAQAHQPCTRAALHVIRRVPDNSGHIAHGMFA